MQVIPDQVLSWCGANRLIAHETKSEALLLSKQRFIGPLLPLKYGEKFSYEIKIYLRLFWLRIINVFLLDRIIIKPWINIMRFVVVFWAGQFHVQQLEQFIILLY